MTKQILLVMDDDTADVVGKRVDELGNKINIEVYRDRAVHEREAEIRVDKTSYNLVISNVDIPRDGNSGVQEGECLGLRFLKRFKERNQTVPVVLLGALYDAEVARQLGSISGANYVTRERFDWDDWLAEVCKKRLLAEIPEPKARHLDVDIILHPPDRYSYKLKVIGLPGVEDEGILDLNKEELLPHLKIESEEAGNSEHWEEHLHHIGEKLGKEIFQSNYEFACKFHEFLGRVEQNNEHNNVTIRFIVERDMHPILLEAVKETGRHYWMLRAPIYRRVKEFTDRAALYQDEETRAGPINCIIIQADVESRVKIPELNLTLGHLENVEPEVKWLCTRLDELKKEEGYRVGEVAVLDGPGEHPTFAEAVRDALKGGKWHIVHYAGHSYFDPSEKVGYLFLPGGPGRGIEKITAELFANWLSTSDTRFVFLSSCHSSEEDFVFELANKHVPAVVGFRWDIEDSLAEKYTECFYTHLFEKRSLEYAFFEARKQMHAEYRDKPIWASPILVIQSKKD